jgi:hypothetical protein
MARRIAPYRTIRLPTTKNRSHPAILHVKSASGQSEYDHYILFLARRWGRALLFDPPEPVKLVHFKELAPLWDGKALLVSNGPIDLGSVLAPPRKRFVLYTAGTLVLILMLRYVKRLLPQAVFRPLRNRIALSIAQAGLGPSLGYLEISTSQRISDKTVRYLRQRLPTARVEIKPLRTRHRSP